MIVHRQGCDFHVIHTEWNSLPADLQVTVATTCWAIPKIEPGVVIILLQLKKKKKAIYTSSYNELLFLPELSALLSLSPCAISELAG